MSRIGGFPLKDKVAVVTGGGSGINLHFVQIAVQQGAKVIVADLKLTEDAEKFMNSSEGGKSAIFVKCDVTIRADLENLIKVSEEKYGDVPDVYIAGAGVFEPGWSNFWDDTEEDRYAELDINVTHAIKLSRIALRALLRKSKKGVILVTASLAGFQGALSAPLYCASKHAVIGFVRSMAELDELEGIKVCAVAPGMVSTPLWLDRPDLMAQFGYDPDYTITPQRVAEDMYELITNGKYPGGTCLENSLGGTRVLGTWNIEPPKGQGTTAPKEMRDRLNERMVDLMRRERGAKV